MDRFLKLAQRVWKVQFLGVLAYGGIAVSYTLAGNISNEPFPHFVTAFVVLAVVVSWAFCRRFIVDHDVLLSSIWKTYVKRYGEIELAASEDEQRSVFRDFVGRAFLLWGAATWVTVHLLNTYGFSQTVHTGEVFWVAIFTGASIALLAASKPKTATLPEATEDFYTEQARQAKEKL